jgi:hemerythrin superfamily protein
MVSTIDDTKRMAIAAKLADMRAIQELLIANEQRFISEVSDQDIRKRLQNMLEDDQKNLGILETVIVEYGNKAEANQTTQKMLEQGRSMMEDSSLSVFEKVAQHELLKHAQVGNGLIIHKAAQKVGADIEAAIGPLNTVNFENRAHQEQLKGVLELLGVRELTGQDADQSLWARVQDAMAAFTGVAGSVVTQSSDQQDLKIRDLIRMEHTKARTLFGEIENSNDPQKIQEYFGQLYKDLNAHAEAEEQVVYPAVRSYYEQTQMLYDEQAEMKQMLDEIKAMSPSAPEFKDRIRQLKESVLHHVREEENDMFPKIRDNFSREQEEQMATQFKSAKSQIQDRMAASTH